MTENNIRKIMDDLFRPNTNMIDEEEDDSEPDLNAEIDAAMDADSDFSGDSDSDSDFSGDSDSDFSGDSDSDFSGDSDSGDSGDGGDDSPISTGDFDDGGDFDGAEGTPEDTPEDTGLEEPSPDIIDPVSDSQKVTDLFTDTGDKAYDYGVGTDSNIRLANFKFNNAKINPTNYMDGVEILTGVPSNVVEDRLSPEQKNIYLNANKKLRDSFPQIGVREKNILIYNSNIPMLRYDLNNNEEPLVGQDEVYAYVRIDEYLTKRFGIYWQDKRDAVKILKEIKVNFSDKNSIQPNLVTADDFTPFDNDIDILPFDKVFVDIPLYIDEFIRSNINNPEFIKSSIFSAISSPYTTGMGKSNSVYAIIKGEVSEEAPEETDDFEGLDDFEGDEDLGDGEIVDEIDELEI